MPAHIGFDCPGQRCGHGRGHGQRQRLLASVLLNLIVATSLCQARNVHMSIGQDEPYLAQHIGSGSSDGNSNSNHNIPRMARVHKSVGDIMGCKGVPSMKMFKMLNLVCEDCFQLYRDAELYHMCRSDCFGSPYFESCMDTLLLEKDDRDQVARLLGESRQYVR